MYDEQVRALNLKLAQPFYLHRFLLPCELTTMSLRSCLMSDLPCDMVEDILSRVPATSLERLRSTCKQWNKLFNDHRFIKKHVDKAPKEYLDIMLRAERVSLMSGNLRGHHDNMDPSIKLKREFSLTNLHYNLAKVDSFEVFHCNGLLLCTNMSNVHVWNPCTSQTEWIQTKSVNTIYQNYALGYVNNKFQNYKILRILHKQTFGLEIYEFNSCSWKVLDSVTPDFQLKIDHISVKGNTYWLASDKELEEEFGEEVDEESNKYFLISFDFTTERFGSHIRLPFDGYLYRDALSLSSVREEELSVLFQDDKALTLEIWITNNITETNALSWSKFFKIDVNTQRFLHGVTFFIDEENKVAVCCDDVAGGGVNTIVFIIGENTWTKVDLGIGEGDNFSRLFSYVPSLVQI